MFFYSFRSIEYKKQKGGSVRNFGTLRVEKRENASPGVYVYARENENGKSAVFMHGAKRPKCRICMRAADYEMRVEKITKRTLLLLLLLIVRLEKGKSGCKLCIYALE